MFSVDKKKELTMFFNDSIKNGNKVTINDVVLNEMNENEMNDTSDDYIEPYYFLSENNNPLAQTFGVFNDTGNNKSYNIFLCIYRINTDCKIPFIEFLVDIDSVPQFPHVRDFSCPNMVETDPTEEHNTYFMNKCLVKLLEILKLHEIFGIELLEKMYKGFVQHDESNIFVVFECFPETNFHPKDNVQWVILDEILFKRTINKKEIDPLLISFFEKQEYMTELFIDESYEHQYPLPFLMFLCTKSKEDSKYYNVLPSIIDLTTLGVSWLGDCYYFSSNIIKANLEEKSQLLTDINGGEGISIIIEPYQRYAVFTYKANYILRDISQCTDHQIKTYQNNNSSNDVLTTYYNENGLSLWCVKSSETFTRI